MIVDGNKYINFELARDTGKTQVWHVKNKSGGYVLGSVEWYAGWRQYVFIPNEDTEYNVTCLMAISSFIGHLNTVKRIEA